MQGAFLLNFPHTPFKKLEKDQQQPWIATLPIYLWLKCYMDIRWTAWC